MSALAVIAIPKIAPTSAVALPANAQKLASDLRYAQTIAMSRGKAVCLKATNFAQYAIFDTVTASGTTQCADVAMTNPVTNNTMVFSLEEGAALSGDTMVMFNSLGKPRAGAVFNVVIGGGYRSVSVDAITGLIGISNSLPSTTP